MYNSRNLSNCSNGTIVVNSFFIKAEQRMVYRGVEHTTSGASLETKRHNLSRVYRGTAYSAIKPTSIKKSTNRKFLVYRGVKHGSSFIESLKLSFTIFNNSAIAC